LSSHFIAYENYKAFCRDLESKQALVAADCF